MNRLKYILIVLTTLGMVACNKSESEPTASLNEPMRFAPADADWLATRATDNTMGDGETMSVFGYFTSSNTWSTAVSTATPNIFYRQLVTKNGGTWSYSPLQYWRSTGYHHFFAFAPHGVATSISTTMGAPSIVFDINAIVSKQIDLLWSYNGKNGLTEYPLINLQQSTADKNIKFNFRHALTKISFYANVLLGLDEGRYSITSIALQDILYQGKTEFKPGPNLDIDGYTGATWQLTAADKKRDFIIAIPDAVPDSPERGLDNKELTYEFQRISSPNGNLYMMPQLIEGATYATPTISLTVYDNKDKKDYLVKAPLKVPNTHTTKRWYSGQAIQYYLTYKGGGDDPFSLKATVTDWENEEVEIKIPGTFLNVSQINIVTTPNATINIYYATDGTPVKGVYNGVEKSLPESKGIFTFQAVAGQTTATIKAGILAREITITAN